MHGLPDNIIATTFDSQKKNQYPLNTFCRSILNPPRTEKQAKRTTLAEQLVANKEKMMVISQADEEHRLKTLSQTDDRSEYTSSFHQSKRGNRTSLGYKQT